MLLGEPQRTPYDLNFTLFGVPIRVHPFFWLAGVLLGPHQLGGKAILVWLIAFFIGIFLHELGHAIAIRLQGGFPWITLYGFGGITSSQRARAIGIGNADAWRQIVVSLAGPLSGFLLAAIVVAAVIASGHGVVVEWGGHFGLSVSINENDMVVSPYFSFFVDRLLFVTIVYGIFNLLPIYPLDGGQIAREVLVMVLGREGVRQSLILSMFAAGTLAIAAGVVWHDGYLAFFFAYFAYSSYATLQAYMGGGPRF